MKKRNNDNISFVPIYIVCFIPLVMWGNILELNLSQYAWFPNREEGMDFFLASKQAVLCSAVLLMIILMGNMAVKKTILGVWKQNTKKTVAVHTTWNIYRDVNRFYMLFGL